MMDNHISYKSYMIEFDSEKIKNTIFEEKLQQNPSFEY